MILSTAFTLLYKLVPLYILILLGYLAGRYLAVDKKSVALLAIYIVTPVVIFYGVSETAIDLSSVLLPLIIFVISSVICICLKYFSMNTLGMKQLSGMIGFASASGNTGYFGIPVAIIIFGEDILGLAALCVLGSVLFENTLGVYTAASGKYSSKEAIQKVLKLPSLYGFLAGLCVNIYGIEFSENITTLFDKFVGTYTILGMMIIGLGLSEIKRASFDLIFTTITALAHFVLWPLLMFLVLYLDRVSFSYINEQQSLILLLLSIVPIAANTVAWATVFEIDPDKVAVSVLLTTLLAAIYIPIFVSIFVL